MNAIKERIREYIETQCLGLENATTKARIMDDLGIEPLEERFFRKLVNDIRAEGVPILSSVHSPNAGYYIPKDESEIGAGMAQMIHRGKEIFRQCRTIERGLQARFGNQIKLNLEG